MFRSLKQPPTLLILERKKMARLNKQRKEITRNDRAVLNGLRYALNNEPLKRRIVIAWRIVRGKF